MKIERIDWNGTDAPAFAARLRKLASPQEEVAETVAEIVGSVRDRGNEALREIAERLGEEAPESWRVDPDAIAAAPGLLDSDVREALRLAAKNIAAVARAELETRDRPATVDLPEGQRVEVRADAVAAAGIYAPGGRAAYPSSVLMCCIPARVAGVSRVAVASPAGARGRPSAQVLAACAAAGVDEVYAIGGAQAIAALAYGTETVPRVDKITGPGNRFVATAKKLVFGTVGIDSIAGPSEVVIIADDSARAEFVAADLLAQAEHDEDSSAILITTSEQLANEVSVAVSRQAESLPRRAIVEKSLSQHGAVLLVDDLNEACDIVNELAPEHLEIVTRDDETLAAKVLHAGAIFLGSYTPEVVGDYFAGPNHVLPTAGASRFSSALGVYDFLKRTTVLRYSREALSRSVNKIATLAKAEGLDAHARSVEIRLD